MPAVIIGNKLVVETNHWEGFVEEYVVVEGEVKKNVIYSKNVCDKHDCGSIAKIELIPKSRRVVVEVYAQMEEHSLLVPMFREFRTRYVWDGEWRKAWTKEYVDGILVRKNVLIPEEDVPEPDDTPEPEEIEDLEPEE
jgi:hypothetical protein